MSDHQKGQVTSTAAEIYEQFFVPALFIDWPPHLLRAVEFRPDHALLDAACGTGIVARAARKIAGEQGNVTGLDINEGMLAVARQIAPDVIWKAGSVEDIPFDDDTFDCAVCQFALMFFEDRKKAITELRRVVKPGGKVSFAVWDTLENTPGYASVAQLLNDLFGHEVAQSIEAPYILGDRDALRELFVKAGIKDLHLDTVQGKARFDSIDEWVYTDIKGWTLADVIDDQDYQRLKQEAPGVLNKFVRPDGKVEFSAPAHIASFIA